MAEYADRAQPTFSAQLQSWLDGDGEKTLGELIEVFETRAFAVVFVILMSVPALPLPTGGATHVFEAIAVLLALELVAGRDEIWLPRRWRERKVPTDGRFITALLKAIRRLERFSRPRLRFMFGHRVSNVAYGLVVAGGSIAAFFAPPFTGLDTLPALGVVLVSLGVLLEDFVLVAIGLVVAGGSIAAFFAPPFTGLDTLPALGVVLVSLGVLLEDFALVAIGLIVGAVGIMLEILVGAAALDGLKALFS